MKSIQEITADKNKLNFQKIIIERMIKDLKSLGIYSELYLWEKELVYVNESIDIVQWELEIHNLLVETNIISE